jgi:hypothetical protein
MAKEINVELNLKYKEAVKNLDDFQKEYSKLEKQVVKQNAATAKSIKNIETTSAKAAKGVKLIGGALKAAGIGLAIAAFTKLVEVLNQNQKVADFFSITFETLSLAFNDFFNYIDSNAGVIINYFKAIFENPIQSIKDFGQAIFNNIVERINSSLEALGYLSSAVVKVFSGDFKGALEDAKNAGKELVDVVTGVDDSFDKTVEIVKDVTQATNAYVKSTLDTAKATVEANKAAEIGIAQNRILLEQFDRQAEKQRQIRDDESLTIDERIAANQRLGEILEEQEKLMVANADALIRAAQLQYDKNKSDENYIALLDARAEREGVLAQIEGFRSEQLVNINSLERDRIALEEENTEKLLELEQQKRDAKQKSFDQAVKLAGADSRLGKAILLAKQLIQAKEFIMDAKALIQKAKNAVTESVVTGAEAGTEVSGSVAKATNTAPPPFNIPFILAALATGAGVMSAVKAAIGATKTAAQAAGGGSTSGGSNIQSPQAIPTSSPPAFNIVGASETNQLAGVIGEQTQQPVKAFVVANDVTTAQSLDRNIVEGASIG